MILNVSMIFLNNGERYWNVVNVVFSLSKYCIFFDILVDNYLLRYFKNALRVFFKLINQIQQRDCYGIIFLQLFHNYLLQVVYTLSCCFMNEVAKKSLNSRIFVLRFESVLIYNLIFPVINYAIFLDKQFQECNRVGKVLFGLKIAGLLDVIRLI